MRVALALPTLAEGDAVGNDVLGMARSLRAGGADVACFARNGASAEPFRPPTELRDYLRSPGDVLIYHHSIGCEWGVRAALTAKCKVAVKYHNVTPPEFFLPENAEVAAGCRLGQRQVGELARSGATLWADSAYNAADFRAAVPGRAVSELPPFTHADELIAGEPDHRAAAGLDDWATTILVVGRLVANKDIPLAVRTLASYRAQFDAHARLVVVGDRPVPSHAHAVDDSIDDSGGAGHVLVTGKVTAAQLKALYLTADVLLVTSRHEGFCVPVVEALGLRVPVVAVPNAAIPGTGGDAVTYAAADPGALAKAIRGVVTDPERRERLMLAGRARYRAQFAGEVVRRRFEELFAELIGAKSR